MRSHRRPSVEGAEEREGRRKHPGLLPVASCGPRTAGQRTPARSLAPKVSLWALTRLLSAPPLHTTARICPPSPLEETEAWAGWHPGPRSPSGREAEQEPARGAPCAESRRDRETCWPPGPRESGAPPSRLARTRASSSPSACAPQCGAAGQEGRSILRLLQAAHPGGSPLQRDICHCYGGRHHEKKVWAAQPSSPWSCHSAAA